MPIEMAWTDALLSLGVGIGLAAAAGLRVFLPLLVLGMAARAGWVPLGDEFAWLASSAGLAALSVATLIEEANRIADEMGPDAPIGAAQVVTA